MSSLHVVFRVGESEYLLPAADVVQMESYTGATKVPGTRDYVVGIVQIRGKIVPVVDLRARFGLSPAAPGPDARVVVGQHQGRNVALLVDAAREVLKVDLSQLKPPPEIVTQEAGGLVKGVLQVSSRILMLLDFAKVIGEE
jgi:purine-binding chemotaxis protein CheW